MVVFGHGSLLISLIVSGEWLRIKEMFFCFFAWFFCFLSFFPFWRGIFANTTKRQELWKTRLHHAMPISFWITGSKDHLAMSLENGS